ncbi:MAG: 7-carboxy-7-deazaguanine synthase QueE [Candidatus Omnitrophica bacterium]|nr:7-carboxy-7-deazaguanine synthase QueE [Candidatus Omnitrophota bacterium]
MKAKIAEVFESIQGEGLYLGERQLFVRFFGCNLECKFCDTKLTSFMEYVPEELLEEIRLYPKDFHSISFTGGEPLLQKDFLKVIMELTHREGHKNYLETNGTLWGELEEVIDNVDIIAMDLKLPGSYGQGKLWPVHRKFLKVAQRKEVFLKAVICHSTEDVDLFEAIDLIKEVNSATVLVLQPDNQERGRLLDKKLNRFKELCLKNGIAACVIPQMHKVIGLK